MNPLVEEWVQKAEGDFADQGEADAARAATEKVRPLLRQALGLS